MNNEPKIFSVSEINEEISALFRELWSSIAVLGEVSNLRGSARGHNYFTLKDENSSLSVAAFRNATISWPALPEDGDRIVVFGRLSVYPPRGEYQLIAEYFMPAGVGELAMRFEKLKEKLAAEGLFDPRKKQPIPMFPAKIGIVTSPTGAAIRDMINVLGRKSIGIDVLIYPALVQGVGAAEQIAEGINELDARDDIETIIIGRGGGSLEDLWAFNEEVLVRAIAECRTPLISAVGHETDFTLADFAADLRAATPTEAAELVVADRTSLAESIGSLSVRLMRTLPLTLREYASAIDQTERRLSVVPERIDEHDLHLDDIDRRLRSIASTGFDRAQSKLNETTGKLLALDPTAVLKRGYAIFSNADGETITSADQVAAGDDGRLRLSSGRLEVKVTRKVN